MTKEQQQYMNDKRPRGCTFVLAQPHCGAELLMKLMNVAGNTQVKGDHSIEFYQHVLGIYKHAFKDGSYGLRPELINYKDVDADQYRRVVKYFLVNLLFKCTIGFAISTVIGLDKDLSVADFVNMLRDLSEDYRLLPITIVYLSRENIDKIDANSNAINRQREYFRDCYELEDKVITYEQLMADPRGTMLKCNPFSYPTDEAIARVML